MKFNLGDKVKVGEDFEGIIITAGWNRPGIEDYLFEVASFEEYQQCDVDFSKKVKIGPTGKDIFLKCLNPQPDNKVFVLTPNTSLTLIEAAKVECRCPIQRLWAGKGHYTGCSKV